MNKIDVIFWCLLLLLAIAMLIWLGTPSRPTAEPNVKLEFNELYEGKEPNGWSE